MKQEALECYDRYFTGVAQTLFAGSGSLLAADAVIKQADDIAHKMVVQRYRRIGMDNNDGIKYI